MDAAAFAVSLFAGAASAKSPECTPWDAKRSKRQADGLRFCAACAILKGDSYKNKVMITHPLA